MPTYNYPRFNISSIKRNVSFVLSIFVLIAIGPLAMFYAILPEYFFWMVLFFIFTFLIGIALAIFKISRTKITIEYNEIILSRPGKESEIINRNSITSISESDVGLTVVSEKSGSEIFIPNNIKEFQVIRNTLNNWHPILPSRPADKSHLWIIITIIAISSISAVGAFIFKIKVLFYVFITTFLFFMIMKFVNDFKSSKKFESEDVPYPIDYTIMDNNSKKFILRPKTSFNIHFAIGVLCFIYLAVSWILEGSDYSGFMIFLTILIGYSAVIIPVIRYIISPLSIIIDSNNLMVRKCFRSNTIFPLSGITSVDYAFWISKLVNKSCWLRLGSDGKSILLSYLFYENTREFMNHLKKCVSGISIDSRLSKY